LHRSETAPIGNAYARRADHRLLRPHDAAGDRPPGSAKTRIMSTSHDDRAALAPPRVEDLGGGLYAYVQPDGSWLINNTGFLVSSIGVICVDGCATERRTRSFVEAVGQVSDRPIRTLVNTHSHADHVTGNALFAGATIVAHELTRTDMLEFRPPPG